MKMKIVADSSANLLALPDIDFGIVPLHVIVGENDYVDDDKIDLTAMQEDLSSYKGKTSTSSPSPHEWENAFGDADVVYLYVHKYIFRSFNRFHYPLRTLS